MAKMLNVKLDDETIEHKLDYAQILYPKKTKRG